MSHSMPSVLTRPTLQFTAHIFRIRILPRALDLWLLSRPVEDDEDETLTSTSHHNASEHPPGFQEFLKLLEVAQAHIDAHGDMMLQGPYSTFIIGNRD